MCWKAKNRFQSWIVNFKIIAIFCCKSASSDCWLLWSENIWVHSSRRKCNLDIVSSSGPPLFLLCTHNLPFFLSSKWISFVTLLGPSWQAWSFKAADTSIRRGETGTNSAIKIRTNGIAGLWHDFANFFLSFKLLHAQKLFCTSIYFSAEN